MRFYDLIEKKRRGAPHTREELDLIVSGAASGSIPDYQLSAWLMAVCFSGMTEEETASFTAAIAKSGDTLDLSELGGATVDKHSTGGVGDKTTLVVLPIVSAAGAVVAKMSGRGLGFTGGTIDKLESVTGFTTELSREEFLARARKNGLVLASQSGNLAPADKRLYALRDVTATVDSLPLIASSVMSKKLAAGARSIVLDVKCGSGAFSKTRDDAEALASAMIDIGRREGRKMAAIISDMSEPLGYAVGSAVEVCEARATLCGRGPLDLTELSLALSSLMLALSLGISEGEARALAEDTLYSGRALSKFEEWLISGGARAELVKNPELLLGAKYKSTVTAERSGFVSRADARVIGDAARLSGAGRELAGDKISPTAGIVLAKKVGDAVKTGDTLLTVYSDSEDMLFSAVGALSSAFDISDKEPQKPPLIHKVFI